MALYLRGFSSPNQSLHNQRLRSHVRNKPIMTEVRTDDGSCASKYGLMRERIKGAGSCASDKEMAGGAGSGPENMGSTGSRSGLLRERHEGTWSRGA